MKCIFLYLCTAIIFWISVAFFFWISFSICTKYVLYKVSYSFGSSKLFNILNNFIDVEKITFFQISSFIVNKLQKIFPFKCIIYLVSYWHSVKTLRRWGIMKKKLRLTLLDTIARLQSLLLVSLREPRYLNPILVNEYSQSHFVRV